MADASRDERSYDLLVNAIRSMTGVDELEEVRHLAAEFYAGDDRLRQLESIIDARERELRIDEERATTEPGRPLSPLQVANLLTLARIEADPATLRAMLLRLSPMSDPSRRFVADIIEERIQELERKNER
jgi:hypothetical protein